MPVLSERQIDAWTTIAAEPAVRAAERTILNRSSTVLADTLVIGIRAETRRRLARILELKEEAERDPGGREAYQRAADDLRSWAARVYLAVLHEPEIDPYLRAEESRETASTKPRNPYTEESISLRRSAPPLPFPGKRGRSPRQAGPRPSIGSEARPTRPAAVTDRRRHLRALD